MKYLTLQQAMLGMRVVLTDNGMLIKSPAGSAEYDHKGRRLKVNGNQDYFPDQLRIKDKRTLKGGYVETTHNGMIGYRPDGSVAWRIGNWDKKPPCVSVEYGYTSDEVREAVEHIKRVRLSKAFGKALADLSPFTVKSGEVFFKDAFIDDGLTTDKIRLRKYGLSEQDVKNASAPNPGYEQYASGGVYTVQPGIKSDGVTHHSGFAMNIESPLKSVVKAAAKSASKDVEKKVADDQRAMDELTSTIRETIRNECRPGGAIWGIRRCGI